MLLFGGQELLSRRAVVEATDALEEVVTHTSNALQVRVAVVSEQRLSAILSEASAYGLEPREVSELIGFDVVAALAAARASLDELVDQGVVDDDAMVSSLRAARRRVDDGTAGPRDAQFLLSLNQRVTDQWNVHLDELLRFVQEPRTPPPVNAAVVRLWLTTRVFEAANDQLASLGALIAPGVAVDQEETPARYAVLFDRTLADALLLADEHVRPYLEAVGAANGFDAAADELAHLGTDLSAGGDIVPVAASVFALGFERDDAVLAATRAAADDALVHASEARAAAARDFARAGALSVGAAAVALALAVIVARSISVPLARLERRARDVSAGELDGAPLAMHGPRDVAVATRSFNEATASLAVVESRMRSMATGATDETPPLPLAGTLGSVLAAAADQLATSLRERDQLAERLEAEASMDSLTGLANRRGAMVGLAELLASTTETTALLFLDLDGLKAVNDAHGHAVGDAVLVQIAERLRLAAPPGGFTARLGGDEFVLAFTAAAGEAMRTARSLHELVEATIAVADLRLHVGGSIGVALAGPGDAPDDLLRWADAALYRAKHSGRGQVAVLDEALRAEIDAQHELASALRRAIDRDELGVHFQPVVDVTTGAVLEVEALARWTREDGTVVTPDRFVAVAERTDLVVLLDLWVLRTAVAQLARWQAGAFPDLGLAVNASSRSLLSDDYQRGVQAVLAEAPVRPGTVTVEVTETGLLGDIERAAERIQELRATGARVAIDDYGTGFTSIAHLRTLPVDRLKIDRSLTDRLEDARERTIVDVVLRVGDALGLEVVAEGVETGGQLDALQRLGCPLAQGYLTGRPCPADELERSLLAAAVPAS